MENIKIETKVSAVITIPEVDLATYQRIVDFIRSVSGDEAAPAPVPEERAEEIRETARAAEDRWAKIPRYAGYDRIIGVFRDAEAHPEKYGWEWMIPKAWMSEVPEIAGISLYNTAHTLGAIAKNGLCKRRSGYNPETQASEVRFRVPVPKEKGLALSDISPEAYRMGQRIRKARKEARLSLSEFSDLIGYAANIVSGWENGTFTVSPDAMESLDKIFGTEWRAEESA